MSSSSSSRTPSPTQSRSTPSRSSPPYISASTSDSVSLSSALSSVLSHSSSSSSSSSASEHSIPSTSALTTLRASLQVHHTRLQEKSKRLDRQKEKLLAQPGLGAAFVSELQTDGVDTARKNKTASPQPAASPKQPLTIKKEDDDPDGDGDQPVLPKPKRIKRSHNLDHDDSGNDNHSTRTTTATPPPSKSTTDSSNTLTSPRIPKRASRQTPADTDAPTSSSTTANEPSPGPAATPNRTRPLGIRLKLNPTRAPTGIAALGAAHRPTGIHPNGLTISPGGPGTAPNAPTYPSSSSSDSQQHFNWALPDQPANIIPAPPQSHPPRAYLTEPAQVDEDFTAMDWKERERQRDREDAFLLPSSSAHSMSASASPAPGQLHSQKDPISASSAAASAAAAAAANRVRSQNQQQVTYQTFQTYVDGWFKTITEEDVAWLARVEDVSDERFKLPPLGRHYKEVWQQEDSSSHLSQYPNDLQSRQEDHDGGGGDDDKQHKNGTLSGGVGPFDPRTLSDEHAYGTASTEAKGGPLAERVLSMLLPDQTPSSINGNGIPAGNPSFPPPPPQDMSSYESSIMQELQFLDLISPQTLSSSSSRQDDEISQLLRRVSSTLKDQIGLNERRRHRLRDIAKDRMAYQDYHSCLLHVEKQIEVGWYKRQSLLKKLISKKKSNKNTTTSSENLLKSSLTSTDPTTTTTMEEAGGGGSGTSTPFSLEQNYLAVPALSEQLLLAMEKRNQLKRALEPLFESMPHSKYIPLPQESVFADLSVDQGGEEDGAGIGE
ncbi:unnamed protein product [Sympodiomycopsis kandeliae]